MKDFKGIWTREELLAEVRKAVARKKTRKGTRKADFVCLECGRKFYSTKAAERAASDGCPGCGGVDIGEEI